MSIYRRFILLFSLLAIILTFLVVRSEHDISSSRIWRDNLQRQGFREWATSEDNEHSPDREALLQSSLNISSGAAGLLVGQTPESLLGLSKFPQEHPNQQDQNTQKRL